MLPCLFSYLQALRLRLRLALSFLKLDHVVDGIDLVPRYHRFDYHMYAGFKSNKSFTITVPPLTTPTSFLDDCILQRR